jgi:hypothetical protein
MRHMLLIFMMLGGFFAQAQNGTKYLSVKGGVGAREIYAGSVSFDYNTKYYNQHEIFGEFMESNNTGYQTLMGGFVGEGNQLHHPMETRSRFRYRF